jgi:hypothetical protein
MPLKKVEFRNPNKMLMQSGHRTFDAKADIVTTGNVISNAQHSSYIRAFNETECNGHTFRPGHLQKFDFDLFPGLPQHVREGVKRHSQDKSIILYEFRHFVSSEMIVHGYLITTPQRQLLERFRIGMTFKSELVLDECEKYVVDSKQAVAV